jgi:hypothetical protein
MNLAVQLYREYRKGKAHVTFDIAWALSQLTPGLVIDTYSASVIIPAALMAH